jgi:hypothetical protein
VEGRAVTYEEAGRAIEAYKAGLRGVLGPVLKAAAKSGRAGRMAEAIDRHAAAWHRLNNEVVALVPASPERDGLGDWIMGLCRLLDARAKARPSGIGPGEAAKKLKALTRKAHAHDVREIEDRFDESFDRSSERMYREMERLAPGDRDGRIRLMQERQERGRALMEQEAREIAGVERRYRRESEAIERAAKGGGP